MTLLAARSRIRRYAITDRSALIATINSVCAEGRWMRTQCYEPTPAWEHALAEPDCPCHLLLVVVEAERVVGWCRVFRDENPKTQADIAIGLLPEHLEQGLGTELFRRAIAWAYAQGLTRLYLSTRADNTRAIPLFEKFGFTRARMLDAKWVEMELLNRSNNIEGTVNPTNFMV